MVMAATSRTHPRLASFERGSLRHGCSPGPVLLPWGAHTQPGTTTGRLETGAPQKCVNSCKFLALSVPQFPCLRRAGAPSGLEESTHNPQSSLGCSGPQPQTPHCPPTQNLWADFPESHLGSPRSKSSHGFLQGGEAPPLTPLSTWGSPPLFLDSFL